LAIRFNLGHRTTKLINNQFKLSGQTPTTESELVIDQLDGTAPFEAPIVITFHPFQILNK
jgi:hypothetical protein